MTLSFNLFQEAWWLSAVTGGNYEEVTVNQGNRVVGRLPFVVARRAGFKISILPPFTHMLGPAIDAGVGKPQSQIMKRLSIARELIDQLPSFAYFKQPFDPTVSGGLAAADGLAFQDCGYDVNLQYTFHIDSRNDPPTIWDAMHTTVRQHIRRAEEAYSVFVLGDPDHFVHFYLANLKKMNRRNRTNFSQFRNLFCDCQSRGCGELLCASTGDGSPVAMAFLAWSHGRMYYLLSTRAPDIEDRGAVSLLLWSAIKLAHKHGIEFDLDGVYSRGTARFLSGFGGKLGTRLIATRSRALYRNLRSLKLKFIPSISEKFA
jgi:hypothetical protein